MGCDEHRLRVVRTLALGAVVRRIDGAFAIIMVATTREPSQSDLNPPGIGPPSAPENRGRGDGALGRHVFLDPVWANCRRSFQRSSRSCLRPPIIGESESLMDRRISPAPKLSTLVRMRMLCSTIFGTTVTMVTDGVRTEGHARRISSPARDMLPAPFLALP